MHKVSLAPNHAFVRAVLICTICGFLGSLSIQPVKADAAPPPDPTVGGVGPYQPQKTNVQMMSETVFIDIPYSPPKPEPLKPIKVRASFTMRNQGQAEEKMQVIFPLTRLAYDYNLEPSDYRVDLSSFVAKVAGKPVPISQVTTPAEILEDPNKVEHGYTMEVLWAAFPVAFPAKQDVLLQVEYEMPNEYAQMEWADFTGIEYILETGAGWYGNILSADITVRLPYQIEEIALDYVKPGYVISGQELHWTLKDIEPTREDNLSVRVVDERTWRAIVDLRASVKQNPKDADSWAGLANVYKHLAIYYAIGGQKAYGGFPYVLNHRTTDLAVEAHRKVVELRPTSGEAHFWLAEILWYTNPKVEKIWSESGSTLGSIQPNDPSIQEVFHELELAWSSGLGENMSWDEEYLVEMINRTVPGLALSPPGAPTATATPVPPTETPAPTATNTSSPTALPTIAPTVSATPIPIETPSTRYDNILLLVTFGLIITGGIFVFRLKSK